MKKLRLWMLGRAYARVTRLERKVQFTQEAREMRAKFFRETWTFVEKMSGMRRKEKRKARRDLVNGK